MVVASAGNENSGKGKPQELWRTELGGNLDSLESINIEEDIEKLERKKALEELKVLHDFVTKYLFLVS